MKLRTLPLFEQRFFAVIFAMVDKASLAVLLGLRGLRDVVARARARRQLSVGPRQRRVFAAAAVLAEGGQAVLHQVVEVEGVLRLGRAALAAAKTHSSASMAGVCKVPERGTELGCSSTRSLERNASCGLGMRHLLPGRTLASIRNGTVQQALALVPAPSSARQLKQVASCSLMVQGSATCE